MFVLTAILGVSVFKQVFKMIFNVPRLITLLLAFLNRRHAKAREAVGKQKNVVDESMMKKQQISAGKGDEIEESQHHDISTDKGFADITDLKNEDFIYVY